MTAVKRCPRCGQVKAAAVRLRSASGETSRASAHLGM
jgi:hypothetical protein